MITRSSITDSLASFDQSMAGKYPVAELLANHIKSLISVGELAPGMEIPGVRELATVLPVSHVNIQKALAICSRDGLLARCPGRKTVVASVRQSQFKNLVYLVIQQSDIEGDVPEYAFQEYFSLLISGMQKELAEHEISLMVSTVSGNRQEELFIERLSLTPPDIVLVSRSKNTALIGDIQKKNIPVALIEPHRYNGEDIPLILHDYDKYAADLANSMELNGCRNVAVIFNDRGRFFMKKRFACMMRQMAEKKILVPEQWLKQGVEPGALEDILKDIFSSQGKPDALIISCGVKWENLEPLLDKVGAPADLFTSIYTDEKECPGASYAVSVDSWKFGISIGKLLINNFFKNGQLVPKEYLIVS